MGERFGVLSGISRLEVVAVLSFGGCCFVSFCCGVFRVYRALGRGGGWVFERGFSLGGYGLLISCVFFRVEFFVFRLYCFRGLGRYRALALCDFWFF